MRPARNLVGLAAALLLSGCSWFTWLPWVDDAPEVDSGEPAKLPRIDPELDLAQQWSAGIGEGLGRKFLRLKPALGADRVFAADGYGLVEARDRFTGKRLWRAQIGGEGEGFLSGLDFMDRRDPSFVTGGVGLAHGMVLLGTTSGDVVALSATDGVERWRVSLGSEVLSTPVGGGRLVFVQTIDGRLVALERETGDVRWSFDNQVPVLTLRGSSDPVYADGTVYAGFADGMVVAVRAESGEPVWQHRVMLPQGRSELERMVDVDSTPVLSGGILYVAAYQGVVKALRANDGSLLWEQEISSFLDLAEGYNQLYVIDEDDVITAIDQRTAQVAWRQEGLFRRGLTSPIAFSNYLVTSDAEGHLHVLAQSDGRFLGRRKVDGDGVNSKPAVAPDQTVYVLGNSGSLRALEIELK